jgi:hypothetical protein
LMEPGSGLKLATRHNPPYAETAEGWRVSIPIRNYGNVLPPFVLSRLAELTTNPVEPHRSW